LTSWQSLTVTWYDESDDYVTSANITSDIKGIPLFTDTGTEEINEANIVLIAQNGDYVTTDIVNRPNAPTPIDQFDRIRIQVTDMDGNAYDRYFEVIQLKPSQSNAEGALLELECWGIEYYLNKIHYVKPFWFSNSANPANDIISVYNSNILSARQPTFTLATTYTASTQRGNSLPTWNVNHYEYGQNEDTCFNRLNDIYSKLGATTASGGVKDFYESIYNTSTKNAVQLGITVQGAGPADRSAALVTIKNTLAVNVAEEEGGISNANASNVLAWGSPVHGTLPLGSSKYASQEFQFRFRPDWSSAGVPYLTDSRVKYLGQHWKATSDHPSTAGNYPGAGPWTLITRASEYGNKFSYSEWTDGKVALWINSGSNPSAVSAGAADANGDKIYTSTGAGFFDSNIIVNDDTENEQFYRTFADVRVTTGSSISTQLNTFANTRSYIAGSAINFPRGFRVLVDGTIGNSPLNGVDKNNVAYGNTVTEWNGTEWVVKYDITSAQDRLMVAVIDEGKNYEYIHSSTSFVDRSTNYTHTGNDCFHKYTKIEQTTSFDPTPAADGFTKNIASAITVTYDIPTEIRGAPINELYYKVGAWLNFAFPFPITKDNSISEKVGEVYGGGGTVPVKEPATLDTTNMGYLSDGTVGFNQVNTEEYGPLSSLGFKLAFSDTVYAGVEVQSIKGQDFPFACFVIDINDNVFRQDFKISFPNHWEEIELPLAGFANYQARTPRFITAFHGNAANLVRPKDIEARNVMEWRNVRFIIIQYMDNYDEFGRYAPETNGEAPSLASWITGALLTPSRIQKLTIDNFRFVKPLLARAAQIDGSDPTTPDRNMEADFLQRPQISTYDQLLSEVKSQQEIEQFRHKEYTLSTTGTSTFDIKFADSFYYLNSKLVSDSDNSTSNNIKLVAKRIEYSITKPSSGNGGLRRRIIGIKRFVA
jgi:hypothetical protein